MSHSGGRKRGGGPENGDERGDWIRQHFRLLVPVAKAGAVIGKGGDFIAQVKRDTQARLSVDRVVGDCPERVAHIEGTDPAGKQTSVAQEALLKALPRLVGEDGGSKIPAQVQVRLLAFKGQAGSVLGPRGRILEEIRSQSGANVRVLEPGRNGVVPACALPDDDIVQIQGSYNEVKQAVLLVTDRLRGADPGPDRTKRPRWDKGGAPTERPSAPPPAYHGHPQPPPNAHQQHQHQQPYPYPGPHHDTRGPPPLMGGPPPPRGAPPAGVGGARGGGGVLAALPPRAVALFEENASLDTAALCGYVSVEYRVLVPVKRIGAILGAGGSVVRSIRAKSGAKVHVADPVPECPERVASAMSTEDVRDPHCSAVDAAMMMVRNLVEDDLARPPEHRARLLLAPGQMGAIMGKGGTTIRALRSLTGAGLDIANNKDLPRCADKGDEMLIIDGPPPAVLEAAHIVFVALRGHMARGQLKFNHAPPAGAPPPVLRQEPPPGYGGGGGPPPPHGGPHPPHGGPHPPHVAPPPGGPPPHHASGGGPPPYHPHHGVGGGEFPPPYDPYGPPPPDARGHDPYAGPPPTHVQHGAGPPPARGGGGGGGGGDPYGPGGAAPPPSRVPDPYAPLPQQQQQQQQQQHAAPGGQGGGYYGGPPPTANGPPARYDSAYGAPPGAPSNGAARYAAPAPPGGQPQQQQQYAHPPPQQHQQPQPPRYGAPPPQPQQQPQQQQQPPTNGGYGVPSPQQQQQYGGGPPTGPPPQHHPQAAPTYALSAPIAPPPGGYGALAGAAPGGGYAPPPQQQHQQQQQAPAAPLVPAAGATMQSSLKLIISQQQVAVLYPKLEQVRGLSGANIVLYDGCTPSGDREMEITGTMQQATAAQNLIQVLITSGVL